MAYNNQSQGNRFGNKPAGAGRPSAQAGGGARPVEKLKALFRTGLFKPKSDKSKAVASIVTEIPADIQPGQRVYIDLYQNSEEEVAAGKPLYVLMMKAAPELKRA